jgi:hypothetical protein
MVSFLSTSWAQAWPQPQTVPKTTPKTKAKANTLARTLNAPKIEFPFGIIFSLKEF